MLSGCNAAMHSKSPLQGGDFFAPGSLRTFPVRYLTQTSERHRKNNPFW
jgi:hypothetical protein